MAKGRRSDFIPRATQQQQPGQGNMMAKIQQMQEEMRKTQEALETEFVNVTAAGGAITMVITGHQRVQSIKLDPALVDPNDIAMLEDTLVAAVNEAILASQEYAAKRLETVTGGISIPGLV
ncbi:MAG: YbaB/EbfC family nucleoid-associated protein [Chloroflexi bacterium]|nr:YbaB/EbfC family nucleoid-associated protein [Chloroflexota bacterium]MCL5273449.1 YbaB/EbfC family nucleoid-associated protein [Chloroflexota bacterium]